MSNGIGELLKKGTGLEATREMFPQLLEAISQHRAGRPLAYPDIPQFLTSEEAKQWGMELQEGWMLKVTPQKIPAEGMGDYTFALRSPTGEDVAFGDVYVTEAGKWLTATEKEIYERERGAEWADLTGLMTTAYPKLFPEYMDIFEDLTTAQAEEHLRDLVGWAQENPAEFLERIRKVGATPETTALLSWMGATEEEIRELLPRMGAEEAWKAEVEPLTHVVVQRFGFLGKAYEITWEVATMPDWAKAWTAGIGDLLMTAGGASKWLGENGLGENLTKEGYQLQLTSPPDTLGEFHWSLLFNPRFYTERVMRALPFSLSLIPAAIIGAYGGVWVAGAVGLGKLGTLILGSLGAAGMSRPMESALEAGGAYDDAISKGMSPEEARKVADEVFLKNLTLVGVDAAQFAVAFAPTPFKVPTSLIVRGLVTTTRVGGKVVITGLSEAGEELYQEIIQRMALGEEITLDAEMQEVMAIGGIMGLGLGVGGDVFVSIKDRTIRQLPEDLKLSFDKSKENFQRVEGLSEDKAELRALDEIAETEEGQKIITDVIGDIKRTELLNQVKPKNNTEQLAWEHMFKDFPEARAIVEKPITLESMRLVARLKGYTITELKTPVSRKPDAKFRITAPGIKVYARNLSEVENFLASGTLQLPPAALNRLRMEVAKAMFESSKGEGYFTDKAGFRGAVNKMSETEVRDLHAMFVRTGRVADVAADPQAHTGEEITELEGELFGLEEWLMSEPATSLRRLVSTTGRAKGEVTHLTLKEYRELTGVHLIPPSVLTKDKKHVRWEFALDYLHQELGYENAEDLKLAIANLNEAMQKVKAIKAELATISPEELENIKLQDGRRRVLEAITEPRTEEEEVPRGTVRHPSLYKGAEDFNAEVMRELFHPIRESPLDVSASAYWREGDFADYVREMPSYSELKLNALSEEVRRNITELEELLDWTNKTIETLRIDVSLTRPAAEEFQSKRLELSQLEHDAGNINKMINELTAGGRLTIDDAAALGIALRTTKGGNLVAAIRRSGFYVTKDFAEYTKFKDVNYRSGRWMDTMTMMEAIDGGYAEGAAQKYILWGTERTYLASNKFVNAYHTIIQENFERFGLVGNKKLIRLAYDVVQKISAEEADFKTAALLRKPEIKELIGRLKQETQTNIVEFAQWSRAFLDDMLRMQNEARVKRDQKPIKYREDYLPWVAEKNIWSMFGIGHKTPSDIFQKPPAPDYIVPDAPFNARAMAREGGMEKYLKEKDVHRLLFDYVRSAGKDIFYTNIIQNAKVHVAALRSMGYVNSARLVEDWASEAYGGVKPVIEKAVESVLPKWMTRAAYMLRRNLTRAVFPLNWIWNITIQPSSIAFTAGRYGTLNTVRGLDYLFRPSARKEAQQAYSWIVKSRRAGKMAYQDIGAQVEKNLAWEGSFFDKAENIANFITNTMETFLTGVSVRAAHHYGKHLGFTGRGLLEYASKGGAKTQSMYNYQDVPALLRAKPVGTLFPFQTFCFQAFNYIREMNFIGKGKAGAYETISAKSAEGQATIQKRVALFLQFLVAIWLINMAVDKATNRKPWVLGSFIPFYSNIVLGTDATNSWNWPVPVQYVMEFWNAFEAATKYDNFTKFRKWVIRYHMLGGTQINRMWDGIEAVLRGGVYDVRGTELFGVYPEEWLKAVAMGPYQTEGGREYVDKIEEKRGKWYEYFDIPFPSRVNIGQEIEKNLAQLGQFDDSGQVYDFSDFASDLREIRRSVGERRFDGYDSPFIKGFLESEESLALIEALGVGPPEAIDEAIEHIKWVKIGHQEFPQLLLNAAKALGLTRLGYETEWNEKWLQSYDDIISALEGIQSGNPKEDEIRYALHLIRENILLDEKGIEVSREVKSPSWEIEVAALQKGIDGYRAVEAILLSALPGEKLIGAEKRQEWRRNHPEHDARLAMWGHGGRIQTKEAYDLVKQWCKELGIPLEHLSTWLPPEEIAPTYFSYIDAVEEHSSNSAEARLIRLENPDFNDWGKDAYRWGDIDTPIEALRISVKWGEMDEQYEALAAEERESFLGANPEYADDRRRRDAFSAGVAENLIEDYVEWFKTERAGYEDDWFLMEHPEFYSEMVRLEQLKERDFSKVPSREIAKLFEGYSNVPAGKERLVYRHEHPDLEEWLVRVKGYTPVGDRWMNGKVDGKEKEEPEKPEKEAKEPLTPWEKAEEARRIKEWIEGLK